jgi:FMN reductase
MPTILLISGSPSPTSKSAAILEYARQRLIEAKVDARTVSVRDFPPQDLIQGKYDSPAFDELKTWVDGADSLIVATPIYKAAYSGALKALLDILPQSAFRGKTVLPLATGGSPSHLLAIDYALKPVLSALGATDILQGVYIVDKEVVVESGGRLTIADELRRRLDEQIDLLAPAAGVPGAL